MPSVTQMRAYLMTLYGDKWKKRVPKMSDSQVTAAYFRITSKKQEKK